MVAEVWASQLKIRSTFNFVLHGGNLENGSGKSEGFILRKFHQSTFSGTVFEGLGNKEKDRTIDLGPREKAHDLTLRK